VASRRPSDRTRTPRFCQTSGGVSTSAPASSTKDPAFEQLVATLSGSASTGTVSTGSSLASCQGVLLIQGMSLRIPAGGIIISIGDDGQPETAPLVPHLRLDLWPTWLGIGCEHGGARKRNRVATHLGSPGSRQLTEQCERATGATAHLGNCARIAGRCRRQCEGQRPLIRPPSTGNICPVMKCEASLAKNTMTGARSRSARPKAPPRGMSFAVCSS
jgi:hypothetical protein